jgi:hypothetical protein
MSTLLRTIDPATTLILPAYRLPLPRQSGLELAV